jgi:hypothetical protein
MFWICQWQTLSSMCFFLSRILENPRPQCTQVKGLYPAGGTRYITLYLFKPIFCVIKGTVPGDFDFKFKVNHRCQRHRWQIEKIVNHKLLNIFLWTPLSSRAICHRNQRHQWYKW